MAKKCNICKQNYNLTNKKPIVINQCFCTHCLECVEDLMRGNNERQILCPGCDSQRTLPEELNENLQIMKELKSFDQLTIICDEHLSKTITFYCLNCSIPVCSDCQFTTHKDHLLTELKQSKFKVYTTNVKSMFEEYSVQNMRSQLDNQATNDILQTASQFQSMVSKVSRMLGHIVEDEERNKIDLTACLGEPQNDPQRTNIIPQISRQIIQGNNQCEISIQDIKHLIYESQSLLREEFKQALDGFESSLTIKEIIQTDQMDQIINDVQSAIDQQIQQFKHEINTGLAIRPNQFVTEDVLKQKLIAIDQNYIQLKKQLDEFNGVFQIECMLLTDQIDEIHAKTDNIKQNCKDQVYEQSAQLLQFEQQLKPQEVKQNIRVDNYVPYVAPIIQAQDQDMQINNGHEEEKMKRNFRILVDKEINKSNYSFLGPQLIKGGIDKKFNLLFRGSTHGFTASTFHELCDDKGPTVIFILSEFGQVFGGYTSLAWKSFDEYGKCFNDADAFVFSLSKKSIHKQYRNQHGAVIHYKGSMCLFGYNDINISDNCDQNNESRCDLGSTYELPKGLERKSYEAKSYLAGQYKFRVYEIEVYQLI
eukprot:403362592